MCQTTRVPDDQPRAASERADAQRAGQVAVAAAVLGLLAVVGILMSVNRDEAVEASRGLSMDDEILTLEERPVETRSPAPEGDSDREEASPESIEVERTRSTSIATVAVGPRGDAGGGDAGTLVVIEAIEPASARPVRVLTPDERYESNAFVLDVITVRADILRGELEAARASGRPSLIRRIERNLAALEVESARLATQGREMEADLGLHGMREATEGGSTSVSME